MINISNSFSYDTIVVGAGGAGLMAALNLARQGFSVACISKVEPTRSHTVAAKGGINAALGNLAEDNWRWHMYDTIKGGDWLADYDCVELMCKSAPQAIRDLEHMGVMFSRNSDGKINQGVYGGQSADFGKKQAPPRACSVEDRTGHAILHTLYQQCLKYKVKFFADCFALDLLYENNKCYGLTVLDIATGHVNAFLSNVTVLATGGFGQAFKNTTSSSICTGDGGAMCLRSGLALQDMEFIQFHPTGIYGSGFLITEAARGAGAYLVNNKGERFMEHYAPNYKDLAPRDVISRAIVSQIKEGNGCGELRDHVNLVVNNLGVDVILKQLPTVYESAKVFAKVDATKEPIPVSPSVHYTMGGIPVNIDCQVLDGPSQIVDGLFAIGEAACMSVHGANRLGCNSLLDLVVFGRAASIKIGQIIKPGSHILKPGSNVIEHSLKNINCLMGQSGNEKLHDIKNALQTTMSDHCGMLRNNDDLAKGIDKLYELQNRMGNIALPVASLMWNNELLELLELENLLIQSIATCYSALKREESRGAHFRDDFSQKDDEKWHCHSLISLCNKNVIDFCQKSVKMPPAGEMGDISFNANRRY